MNDEINEQTIFAFFENLHIDLNVAIERRESFDATTDRETISVQNIDFLDVAIDKDSDAISKKNSEKIKIIDDSTTNFDNVKNEKIIDRKNVKDETIDCDETDFDFFA